MARKRGSRVWETDTITGTGSFSLDGAVSGFRAFSAICANTDTVEYFAINRTTPAEWEHGIGTWATGNTLARTTILESSNAGAVVSFGSGTKDIFLAPAPRSEEPLFIVAVGDETTALVTGDAKITFHAPMDFTLEDIIGGLSTVSSSGAITVDINKAGSTIFATKLTIDASEETSLTAAAYNFVSSAARVTFAKGDKVVVDLDGAGTGAKGLKLYFMGYKGH